VRSVSLSVGLLLIGFGALAQQTPPWLTDEQARDVVAAAIRPVYPEPCYSTYRNEVLESAIVNLRSNPLADNRLKESVYFYRVASDNCEYVALKDGKPVRMTLVTMDCCEYGIVAVDRATSKSYWFTGDKKPEVFKQFAHDAEIRPDLPNPNSFIALYRELVWNGSDRYEIRTLEQLRNVVQENLQSAYSPYEKDNVWQKKFDHWWQRFLSRKQGLKFETTHEQVSDGTIVRGYGFRGFELTTPRSDPPPKGKPKLFIWALLLKPDGTVDQFPSKVAYSAR